MPRPLIFGIVIVVALIVALVALSRIDSSRPPREVIKVLPDNAIAR